jgi:hypothetical protein
MAARTVVGIFLFTVATCHAQTSEILRADCFWRVFPVWKTEQARLESGELAYVKPQDLGSKMKLNPVEPTRPEPPPAEWMTPAFDDAAWPLVQGPFDPTTTKTVSETWPRSLAALCLRGQFDVVDPAQAKPLSLELAFRGGSVVYLNGREVGRFFLPKDKLEIDTPAEDYPKDAYAAPDGNLLRCGFGDTEKYKEQFALRSRKPAALLLPAALLRKGVNVLAVELHRAPTAEMLYTGKAPTGRNYCLWSMLSLDTLALTGTGATPVAKPAAPRVFNDSVLRRATPEDVGLYAGAPRPVVLCGARNGTCSAQLTVDAPAALSGVQAVVVGELKGAQGGALPAAAVQVRYAIADTQQVRGFDGLEEEPPVEVPLSKAGVAVQPIVLTVHVPRDAKAGTYDGKVVVRGVLPAPIEVPLQVKVSDFTLPDPQAYATFFDLVQSPDTLATAYNVPMWSEAHWKLIDRSFELMAAAGCKAIYVPILRRTHFGNEHGLVRWVKRPDGTFTHDFSIAERYLDTAMKHLGKVPVVVMFGWTSATGSAYFGGGNDSKDSGMPYTLLDLATGKIEEAEGPKWGAAGIREFLKPVYDGLQARLEKRGIGSALVIGTATDARPRKEAVADIAAIAPGLKWAVATHPYTTDIHGTPVGYLAHVWGITTTPLPADGRYYGWRNPSLITCFPRYGCSIVGHSLQTWSAPSAYRVLLEAAITSPGKIVQGANGKLEGYGLRGVGRLGADFWPVIASPQGGKLAYHSRYQQTGYGDYACNLGFSADYLLAMGKKQPISSIRFEMLKEGIQEAEARIAIEKELLDPAARAKLGEELAGRCQAALDRRTTEIVRAREGATMGRATDIGWVRFRASGWQPRTVAVYDLAGEVVARTAGARP